MSNRIRLLRVSTAELKRLLDLPETTEIQAACTDPMTHGEVLLRIEDPSFVEIEPGVQIPKCEAWYETVEQRLDDAGNVIDRRAKFKAYL